MRSLKKVLAFVVTISALINIIVIPSGAVGTYENFADKDKIVNSEAVNTMVTLGVINGKGNGSYFDPEGIVTRAEMAKLIAVTMNGGKDPAISSSGVQFTDTTGNWAEHYIAWCSARGIISGKGDGTFGPSDPVTGTAAAKMLLAALGYRADIEGLTGNDWAQNTYDLAQRVGLYNGLDNIDFSVGLNRDNTALLLYNGVHAQEVEYDSLFGGNSGVVYAQEIGTVLENHFDISADTDEPDPDVNESEQSEEPVPIIENPEVIEEPGAEDSETETDLESNFEIELVD